MKAKTILSAVLTAICWISLCLDWDICMYISGLFALVIVGLDDLKVYFRVTSKWVRKISAKRSIRKEVVTA